MKSYILEIIKSSDNWRQEISDLGINIKEDGDLAIFNYGIDVDNFNPVVREARGIIIDTKELRVVCWPFSRFFNSYQPEAAEIDWNSCRVEDKIDGSIIKLYYYEGGWRWATNGCINAWEASVSSCPQFNFLDLIMMAVNYNDIDFDYLNKNYTYMFELVSPFNQIVVKYPYTKLYHIGTRHNEIGEEIRWNIGVERPKTYEIYSLEDCLKAADSLNDTYNDVRLEGFVVVDNNWNRIKIKSPKYLMLHHTWNNGNINKEKMLEMIRTTDLPIEEICNEFDRIAPHVMYYKYRLVEFEHQVAQFIDYVRGLYEEYEHDKKAVALTIKDNPLSGFGFESIKPDKINLSAKELVGSMQTSKLCKYIPDYVEEVLF